MGYSVSDIVNGTKRNVAGALSCMTETLGKKSAKISEKMRNLTEQLENCGKPDEPKKTSNVKNKVSEVDRDISRGGNVLDLNKTPHDLTPLESIPCKLFRMDEQDIVAEAIWVTNDPTTLVYGCELGRNACMVWVTNAIDPNAKVWRPTFGIQKMEEAIKSTIAWPADHIIYDVHFHYDNEAGGSGKDSTIKELKSDTQKISHSVGVTVKNIQELKSDSHSVGITEKMRSLSEKLENCGKVDEQKEMSNPKKVIEVSRNISHNGNVVDLNKKLYDLVPLQGIS
ncbi:hypothetical protein FRX31_020422 [Thalictrum thalictroides]|uniref:Uncharacterized protein n=1 Tax=Thalictrum thalictroides TaxID=46969 RepID=A0A7J6VYQ5_THATH|nr:hypothetical protein FRX31_020422 [Thalictrum thalictroides]